MAKKRSKKNCNYKNYNHNNHRNCNSNNKEPDIKMAVGHKQLLNYAPSIFDKSLFRTVKLCSDLNYEEVKNTEPICLQDIDFNLTDNAVSMTLSFENEHKFECEMRTKIMPIITKKVLDLIPVFVVDTFNGTELVSQYIIFPDTIGVIEGSALVVNYSRSFVAKSIGE